MVQGIVCQYVLKSKKRNNPPRPSAGSGSSVPKVSLCLLLAALPRCEADPARWRHLPGTTLASLVDGGQIDAWWTQRQHPAVSARDRPRGGPEHDARLPAAGAAASGRAADAADAAAAEQQSSLHGPVIDTVAHSGGRSPCARKRQCSDASCVSFLAKSSLRVLKLIISSACLTTAWPAPSAPAQPTGPVYSLGASPIWETPEYADSLSGLDLWPPTDLAFALLNNFFERIHPVRPRALVIAVIYWRRSKIALLFLRPCLSSEKGHFARESQVQASVCQS